MVVTRGCPQLTLSAIWKGRLSEENSVDRQSSNGDGDGKGAGEKESAPVKCASPIRYVTRASRAAAKTRKDGTARQVSLARYCRAPRRNSSSLLPMDPGSQWSTTSSLSSTSADRESWQPPGGDDTFATPVPTRRRSAGDPAIGRWSTPAFSQAPADHSARSGPAAGLTQSSHSGPLTLSANITHSGGVLTFTHSGGAMTHSGGGLAQSGGPITLSGGGRTVMQSDVSQIEGTNPHARITPSADALSANVSIASEEPLNRKRGLPSHAEPLKKRRS